MDNLVFHFQKIFNFNVLYVRCAPHINPNALCARELSKAFQFTAGAKSPTCTVLFLKVFFCTLINQNTIKLGCVPFTAQNINLQPLIMDVFISGPEGQQQGGREARGPVRVCVQCFVQHAPLAGAGGHPLLQRNVQTVRKISIH